MFLLRTYIYPRKSSLCQKKTESKHFLIYTFYRREVYLCNCLKIKVIYKKEPYFRIVFFQNLASAFMHSLLKLLILQLTSLLYWSYICTYSAKYTQYLSICWKTRWREFISTCFCTFFLFSRVSTCCPWPLIVQLHIPVFFLFSISISIKTTCNVCPIYGFWIL